MSQETRCPDPRELEQFEIGALPDEQSAPLEMHLAQCSQCVGKLETLHGRDTLIDAMRAQGTLTLRPTAGDRVRSLMDQLKALRGNESLTLPAWHSLDQTPPPAALAGRLDLSFLAPPQQPDELGRLGAYRVLRVLGRGGMGIVFEAEDSDLRRVVALKVLHPAWAHDPSAKKRFLREGQAAAAIVHDNLVSIYQVGEDRGVMFMAMQLLRGETLHDRWRRCGKLAPVDIRRIGMEIAEGLTVAHQCGLVHRDIKPANIWLEPYISSQSETGERVKILDFGLARPADDDANLTDPGMLVGTPMWLAPEQADGLAVDCRSDLFSLGSVLYALCTGEPPFRAKTGMGVLRLVCDASLPPVKEINPEISIELSNIIAKLHAKDPADRYQTAAEVAEALRKQNPVMAPTITASRTRIWLVAACLAVVTVAGLALTEGAGITHVTSLVPSFFKELGADPATKSQPIASDTQIAMAGATAARVYPAAVFPFEERSGAKDYGVKVTDLLIASLGANPALVLVERGELSKLLAEQSLNLSGIVNPSTATRVGQLTGPKILIVRSIVKVDKTIYLVARVVGTETSRVMAVKVQGAVSDALPELVDKLASAITDTIAQKAEELVDAPAPTTDRIKALSARLKNSARPALWFNVTERHIGQASLDPAAETELTVLAKGCKFPVIDSHQGTQAMAEILFTGAGISEMTARHGNLVSVKARVELKAVERRTGQVLASDRQTAIVVDLTEQIAAKAALEEAAALLAERVLPKLVK